MSRRSFARTGGGAQIESGQAKSITDLAEQVEIEAIAHRRFGDGREHVRRLFVDNGCAACHSGINVGGDQYQPFGVVELPGAEFLPPHDKGRFEVTKSVSDEYVFKVPSLRNIALTPPYFHTGRSWDLRQAVAVMGASQLGINLTDEEVDKITAFLGSLTGEQPDVTYPVLPPSVATTPRPRP